MFLKFYDNFEEYDSKFIVIEYCDGGSLEDLINDQRDGLKIKKALKIIYKVGLGIYYLHKNNITHRDLKCDNILIQKNQYKIIDFGFSTNSRLKTTNLGTPLYMAPELINLKKTKYYSNKVDVWALNVILYNLLTNDYFFYADRKTTLFNYVMRNKFKIERKYRNLWSEELQDLLKLGFQKDPKIRPNIVGFLDHPVFEKLKIKYSHLRELITDDIEKNGKF